MLRFLLDVQKALFQIFRASRFGWTIQKFFLREKNPGRLRLTFLCFSNGQMLVQPETIDRNTKKYEIIEFFLLWMQKVFISSKRHQVYFHSPTRVAVHLA